YERRLDKTGAIGACNNLNSVALDKVLHEVDPEEIARCHDEFGWSLAMIAAHHSGEKGESLLRVLARHDGLHRAVAAEGPHQEQHPPHMLIEAPGSEEQVTALAVASRRGDVTMAKLLVELKADVGRSDRRGWTPLHWAAMQGHDDCVRLLAGTIRNSPRASTALQPDSYDHGDGVDAQDLDGQTSLHWAARLGKLSAVLILAGEFGCRLDIEDCWGQTPVEAVDHQLKTIEWLQAASRVNRELLRLARINNIEAMKRLIAAGIVEDDDEESDVPSTQDHSPSDPDAIEYGADDHTRWAGILKSTLEGSMDGVKLLIARGADPRVAVDLLSLSGEQSDELATTTNKRTLHRIRAKLINLAEASEKLMDIVKTCGVSDEQQEAQLGPYRECLEVGARPDTLDDDPDGRRMSALMWTCLRGLSMLAKT
ncbi:hypothetical protein FOZ63_004240, partial [Perkinsus olseni]